MLFELICLEQLVLAFERACSWNHHSPEEAALVFFLPSSGNSSGERPGILFSVPEAATVDAAFVDPPEAFGSGDAPPTDAFAAGFDTAEAFGASVEPATDVLAEAFGTAGALDSAAEPFPEGFFCADSTSAV